MVIVGGRLAWPSGAQQVAPLILIHEKPKEESHGKKSLIILVLFVLAIMVKSIFCANLTGANALRFDVGGSFAKNYTDSVVKGFEDWSGAKVTVVLGGPNW